MAARSQLSADHLVPFYSRSSLVKTHTKTSPPVAMMGQHQIRFGKALILIGQETKTNGR